MWGQLVPGLFEASWVDNGWGACAGDALNCSPQGSWLDHVRDTGPTAGDCSLGV
jgi:hypothetical protein